MEEKFYIIKPAVDTEETGHVYPAVVSFDDYDFKGPNSVHKLKFGEFPDFIPDIRFKLAKGAKLCDVMGQATINALGLIISPKLNELLNNFSLENNQQYICTISNKNEIENFNWCQFVWSKNLSIVDFKNSIFKYKISRIKYVDYKFQHKMEYLSKEKELGFFNPIIPIELYTHPIKFDLFTHPFKPALCINQKLYNSLQENNISGTEKNRTPLSFISKI